MQELQKIQDFLAVNRQHKIDVFDNQSKHKFHIKIGMDGLLQHAENLESLILNIRSKHGVEALGIQKFKPNGSSYKKNEEPFIIEGGALTIKFQEKKEMPEAAAHPIEITAPVARPVLTAPQNNYGTIPPQPQGYGMAAPMGMSMPDMFSLHSKADRYDDLKSQNEDLKTIKRKLESEVENLINENRNLKTDLSVAEKKSEMEVLREQLKKKPFIDPALATGLLGALKNIGPGIMGNNAMPSGMAGAEEHLVLSETKQFLFNVIKDENVSDGLTEELLLIAFGLQKSQQFTLEVRELIKKHNLENKIS